jgi:general secretion pathway protein E
MKAVGCHQCRNTGYLGRVAIYEMLPLTPKLRHWIRPGLDLPAFRAACIAEGLRTLRQSAADQVAKGVTTIEEVLTVLPVGE